MIPRMIAVAALLCAPASLWAQSREEIQAQKQAAQDAIAKLQQVPIEFAKVLMVPSGETVSNPSRSEVLALAQRNRNQLNEKMLRAETEEAIALSAASESAALRAVVHVRLLQLKAADAAKDVRILNDDDVEEPQRLIDRKASLQKKILNLLDLELRLMK